MNEVFMVAGMEAILWAQQHEFPLTKDFLAIATEYQHRLMSW